MNVLATQSHWRQQTRESWMASAVLLLLALPPLMPTPAQGTTAPFQTPPAQTTPGDVLIADSTRRFPLRREGGGTRAACASRLVAHLVPEKGELDPGKAVMIGLIEGPTAESVPLVLRVGGQDWMLAARPTATLRLFRLPQPPDGALWESFPACEGTAEPQAPPARSLLLRPGDRPGDRPYQVRLKGLWSSCGRTIASEAAIEGWNYGQLLERLPKELAVVCESLSQGGASIPGS